MSTDPIAELELLREPPAGGVIVDRSDRGFVDVTGTDALSFLQALVSADLDPLADGDAAVSLLLHPQGKLDVAFRLVRAGDDAWLDTDPGFGPQLVASLERFRIRVDAQIVDRSPYWGMVTVLGVELAPGRHGSVRVVRTPVGADVIGPWSEITAIHPGLGGGTPLQELADLRDALGAASLVGADAWEAFRIEQGMPTQPLDLDDSTIPQEAELEVDAVSFTKGCFIGQELVCRIDSRGHVNRFLRRLAPSGGARLSRGDEIATGGKVVGVVTSATAAPFESVGLGYVRREVEPGATVEVGTADGVVTTSVHTLRADP
jgi:tRNA-modifying protein YgfZ